MFSSFRIASVGIGSAGGVTGGGQNDRNDFYPPAEVDSQNLCHSAKVTYSPLRRWGEWRRDGPTTYHCPSYYRYNT
eukprot:6211186-Pleurochrysis_carterae.AAC.1